MEKIYLGEEFIESALSSVETKKTISSTTVGRYLMRAAMSGARTGMERPQASHPRLTGKPQWHRPRAIRPYAPGSDRR